MRQKVCPKDVVLHIRHDDVIPKCSSANVDVDSGFSITAYWSAICCFQGFFLGTLCPVVWGWRDD